MTGSEDSPSTRPISVAELLARNGTLGSPPVGGRRRRRRGNADAITVAELTGEIPVVTDSAQPTTDSARGERERDWARKPGGDTPPVTAATAPPETEAERSGAEQDDAESLAARDADESPVDVTPRRRGVTTANGAEQMIPDPLDEEEDPFESPVDLADPPEIDYAESDSDDIDDVDADGADESRSWLRSTHDELFGGPTVVDPAADTDTTSEAADTDTDDDTDDADTETTTDEDEDDDVDVVKESRIAMFLRGVWVVGQCLLAVAFGAGLFLAFDQLWQWNSVVTLVLSMLVILGLVAGVRVVRKTEDITSTMIAVVVGALVTFGPLALQLQSS